MTAAIAVTANAMTARLQQALAPTRLEVIDESGHHAGHAGAHDPYVIIIFHLLFPSFSKCSIFKGVTLKVPCLL